MPSVATPAYKVCTARFDARGPKPTPAAGGSAAAVGGGGAAAVAGGGAMARGKSSSVLGDGVAHATMRELRLRGSSRPSAVASCAAAMSLPTSSASRHFLRSNTLPMATLHRA